MVFCGLVTAVFCEQQCGSHYQGLTLSQLSIEFIIHLCSWVFKMPGFSFLCKICNASITSEEILVDHVHHHFNINFYVCEICQLYSSKSSQDLHIHIKTKHGTGPYSFMCPFCKTFTDGSIINLGKHIFLKSCSAVKCMKFCPFLCRSYFKSDTELFKHLLKRHFPTVEVFEYCTECSYSSSSSLSLTQHMRDAHDLDYEEEDCESSVDITCHLCKDYTCQREQTFIRHMKTKHPNYSYNCPYGNCPYSTIALWKLADHVTRTHLKYCTQYYECSECETSFQKQHSLKQHLNDKHGISKYCCICNSLCHDSDLVDHLYDDHNNVFTTNYCSLCDEDCSDDEDLLLEHLADKHDIHIPDNFKMID